MSTEHETILYRKIKHINIMVVDINLRTYHEHSDYEVLAILRGKARIRLSTAEFMLPAGSFAVFNSRMAHEIESDGGQATALVIQFSPYFCREYYPHARRMMIKDANVSNNLNDAQIKGFMLHICKMALHYVADGRLFGLRCLEDLMHLLILMTEELPCEYLNPEQHHSRISKEHKIDTITSYLDSKYQYPIRLEEVAKLVEMTPAYLSHFITKNLGVNFHDYLNNLRFEHALRQIDRDLPLGDISNGSGFSDLKYMTKMFLKKTGMTPAEYRHRNEEVRNRQRRKSVQEQSQLFLSEEQSLALINAYLEQ